MSNSKIDEPPTSEVGALAAKLHTSCELSTLALREAESALSDTYRRVARVRTDGWALSRSELKARLETTAQRLENAARHVETMLRELESSSVPPDKRQPPQRMPGRSHARSRG